MFDRLLAPMLFGLFGPQVIPTESFRRLLRDLDASISAIHSIVHHGHGRGERNDRRRFIPMLNCLLFSHRNRLRIITFRPLLNGSCISALSKSLPHHLNEHHQQTIHTNLASKTLFGATESSQVRSLS